MLTVEERKVARRCFVCKDTRKLSKHHIIPRAIGGKADPDNLVYLCPACHDWVEQYAVDARCVKDLRSAVERRYPFPKPDLQRFVVEEEARVLSPFEKASAIRDAMRSEGWPSDLICIEQNRVTGRCRIVLAWPAQYGQPDVLRKVSSLEEAMESFRYMPPTQQWWNAGRPERMGRLDHSSPQTMREQKTVNYPPGTEAQAKAVAAARGSRRVATPA